MFALLSTQLRRWLLLAVGIPVAAWALDRLGLALQRRRAGSRAGSALRQTSGWLRYWRSGDRRQRRFGRRPTRPGW